MTQESFQILLIPKHRSCNDLTQCQRSLKPRPCWQSYTLHPQALTHAISTLRRSIKCVCSLWASSIPWVRRFFWVPLMASQQLHDILIECWYQNRVDEVNNGLARIFNGENKWDQLNRRMKCTLWTNSMCKQNTDHIQNLFRIPLPMRIQIYNMVRMVHKVQCFKNHPSK